MRKFFLIIFSIISCPRPGVQKISAPDYLKEAQRVYQHNPIYAFNLLNDTTIFTTHKSERATILAKIYIDQREYERAAAVLDSVNWSVDLTPYENDIILLKTKRWNKLTQSVTDPLLKGISLYNLGNYTEAIEFLSTPSEPDDYRVLYLAKAYERLNDFSNAYTVLIEVDSVSPYLHQEYQDLIFSLFINIEDVKLVQRELSKLKKPYLKEYTLLKVYERLGDNKNIINTAWRLITKYPESIGALYAIKLIKPKTSADHKAFGKVYYYHGDYENALKHFNKSTNDNAVNYYTGMIFYYSENYSLSLSYLSASSWAAAYYYRGRIYEKNNQFKKAIAVYDSLNSRYTNSKYAIRGTKRKAFLFEDIGDTLKAVEAFLQIDDKNTKFRAAMQLYRVGNLSKADSVLSICNDPEFIYWRIRARERLGQPVGNLKKELIEDHPLSYYTLVRYNSDIAFDTIAIETWMKQLGDSITSFSTEDSVHLGKAIRYFYLNEINFAIKELDMIEDKSAQDLLYLSRLCSQYSADRPSILYSLKIKKIARQKNIQRIPIDLYKLMYPIRYTFSITDQNVELSLCLAMIWQESLFDPDALSPANAQGIMQIIPPTAKSIASDLGVESYSLQNPSVSIRFGCYYFSNLLNSLNSVALSLAGYNAGPMRVKRWVKHDPNYEIDVFIELIPYNETRNYVKLILARQIIYKKLMGG